MRGDNLHAVGVVLDGAQGIRDILHRADHQAVLLDGRSNPGGTGLRSRLRSVAAMMSKKPSILKSNRFVLIALTPGNDQLGEGGEMVSVTQPFHPSGRFCAQKSL